MSPSLARASSCPFRLDRHASLSSETFINYRRLMLYVNNPIDYHSSTRCTINMTKWKQYDAWAKEYGPVVSLKAGKDTLILLTSQKAAHTLLNARSANYASRPVLHMAGDLLYGGMHVLLSPWNATLKRQKKLETPFLSARAAASYAPLHHLESLQLIKFLLDYAQGDQEARKAVDGYPGAYGTGGDEQMGQSFGEYSAVIFSLHRYAASLMHTLIYGRRIAGNEKQLHNAQTIQEHFSQAMQPGWTLGRGDSEEALAQHAALFGDITTWCRDART